MLQIELFKINELKDKFPYKLTGDLHCHLFCHWSLIQGHQFHQRIYHQGLQTSNFKIIMLYSLTLTKPVDQMLRTFHFKMAF